jgi:rhamnosyltransferase
MPRRDKVLAVVVTYHPDGLFPERLERLVRQVPSALIVDNHSDALAVSMLREVASQSKTDLILNSVNVGQAAALNTGIERAILAGYEWGMLFDQDTMLIDGALEELQQAYEQFPEKDRLAVIGSNYRDPQTGKPCINPEVTNCCLWKEMKVVVTSGSLISLQAYQVIGPFRAEYFIDCVDLEYCLRARSKGFKVIMTSKPLMVHGIGQPKSHRFLWKDAWASNHSPLRRYFMMRNHIDLARKYLVKEPWWMLVSLGKLLKSIILLFLFEQDRLTKARYVATGLLDGLFAKFDRKLG